MTPIRCPVSFTSPTHFSLPFILIYVFATFFQCGKHISIPAKCNDHCNNIYSLSDVLQDNMHIYFISYTVFLSRAARVRKNVSHE